MDSRNLNARAMQVYYIIAGLLIWKY